MKRIGLLLCTTFLLFALSACNNSQQGRQQDTQSVNNSSSVTVAQTLGETDKVPQSNDNSQSESDKSDTRAEENPQSESGSKTEDNLQSENVSMTEDNSQLENDTQTEAAPQPEELPQTGEPQVNENEKENTNMLTIQIGDKTLTAVLENNSSAEALKELLSKGSLTLNMSDYGGMEKTATLPEKLPQNNESINTDAGDLILYQGNIITIYYDTNSWSLTRLGKIQDISKSELQDILGKGDVSVTFSLGAE